MNEIIERMRSGKRITETDADFPRLCEEVEKQDSLSENSTRASIRPMKCGRCSNASGDSRWTVTCVCSRRSIRLSAKRPVWAKRCSSTSAARSSIKAASRSKTAYLSGREPKSSQKVIPKNPNSVIRCIPSRSLFAATPGSVRER